MDILRHQFWRHQFWLVSRTAGLTGTIYWDMLPQD